MMPASVEDAVSIYRQLAQFPKVKCGRISMEETPGHLQVYSEWSQRDLERSEMTKFARGHIVQLDVVIPTPPHQISDEQWNKESPSGRYRAIVRKVVDKKKGEDKQWIEVWNDSRRLHNIDVMASEQHGKVYDDDGQFGTLQWSYAETHLLYVAEQKSPKTKSYFEGKLDKTASSSGGMSDVTVSKGDEFVYRDCWGEQLSEKSQPVLCVLDIETGGISLLENLPEGVSPGQAVWCPDDLGIVCVGWFNKPYRLGLVYCTMRRSTLFHIDLKNFKCTNLIPSDHGDRAVVSPVFSPDLTKLVYLDSPAGGPHRQCSRLMMCDWATKGIVMVVDVVHSASKPDEFPGLFTLRLEETCWSDDSKRVVLTSQWRSRQELVLIHVEAGLVTRLTSDPLIGSWTLLDIKKDLMLVSCSSPCQPDYLAIGKLPADGRETTIKWLKLDAEPLPLTQLSWKVVTVAVPEARVNHKYPSLNYEYILLEPRPDDKVSSSSVSKAPPPLAVCIHGGPHSSFVTNFELYMTGLSLCGYAVLMVNYRGSAGFGQDSIDSLLGHIGNQDLHDVQSVVEQVVSSGCVDRARVVVIGGSHGGFLTAHAIGQFTEFYRAAVARNPVINLASMVGSSDIPDWVFTECGLHFDPKTLPSADLYTKVIRHSPIVNADHIHTPLMLMLGGKDLRVPPSQGLEMKKALEARHVPVRVLWYPDCSHPLSDVKSEADAFINIIKWFGEHIGSI
jgi:acylaminoacyl-peptidase